MANRSEQIRASLKEEFARVNNQPLEDPELLSKCESMCAQYSLTPADLALKWEGYLINNKIKDSKVNAAQLDKLRNSLLKESLLSKRKTTKKETSTMDSKNIDDLANIYQDLGADVSSNDLKKQIEKQKEEEMRKLLEKKEREREIELAMQAAAEDMAMDVDNNNDSNSQNNENTMTSSKAVSRTGEIMVQFNENLSLSEELVENSVKSGNTVNVELDQNSQSLLKSYRYMSDKIPKRSEVMGDRLDNYADMIVETLSLDEPLSLYTTSPEPIVGVGRVCCEVEGRLNESSVVLETTRATEQSRVKLILSDLKGYSLFPGQIIAVEGVNPTGKLFVVSKIHDGLRLPFHSSNKKSKEEEKNPTPLSIVVGVGPWTINKRLDYSPFDELLELVDEKTNLLILVGPFIDIEHPNISSCDVDFTFEEFFKMKFSPKLKSLSKNMKTILIPSLNDVFHDSIFPQPAFDRSSLDIDKDILLFPNPCTFKVNGVSIGINSTDVFRHLASEDCTKLENPNVNKMSLICDYLIKQRSYYPLFPPHTSVNLDSSHIDGLDFPYTPDILILPSDLKQFVKNVQNSVCINPGKVSKSNTNRGTYAKIVVQPPTDANEVGVASRTRVDVVYL